MQINTVLRFHFPQKEISQNRRQTRGRGEVEPFPAAGRWEVGRASSVLRSRPLRSLLGSASRRPPGLIAPLGPVLLLPPHGPSEACGICGQCGGCSWPPLSRPGHPFPEALKGTQWTCVPPQAGPGKCHLCRMLAPAEPAPACVLCVLALPIWLATTSGGLAEGA